MIDTENTAAVGFLGDLDAAGVLASISASRAAEQAEAARQLDLAARWADLHPTDSLANAAAFTALGLEDDEPIAGEGFRWWPSLRSRPIRGACGDSKISLNEFFSRPPTRPQKCRRSRLEFDS